jgi:phosphoribosylformylglycinamidine synthase
MAMILFYQSPEEIYAIGVKNALPGEDLDKLYWLFGKANRLETLVLDGFFVGPRKEMVTPWSTNAVEITLNMGITGIERIETFKQVEAGHSHYDPMLQALYPSLDQQVFTIEHQPDKIRNISDIAKYSEQEGLALSEEEIEYLSGLSVRLGRPLTDSEVFGFSQVNSEHCRHKIFNGQFIINGLEMPETLFALIKKTSKINPNRIVSAYHDNVAFIVGPDIEQFAPVSQDKADLFGIRDIRSVISLKAETHNFPTTVEPFNGAATGSGGEIRDRMAGGKASMPLIGTAVYMTSYPRLDKSRSWEFAQEERNWLYQTPEDILIKASNGASDFGNKFGQPLLCGSLLTFEHAEDTRSFGYDKVIMLAGGVGFGKDEDAAKDIPETGDIIVVLGGDNYRIGMGGGAVSSVATGEYANKIELNAVQRSNPEMQKRVYNAIRAFAESGHNPIRSIHDHGAGGHLNCLSELVDQVGGEIYLDKLPIGDPTLSAREIIGNESQERMGLVLAPKDVESLRRVASRERAPMYEVGRITGDKRLMFVDRNSNEKPIDLALGDFFGQPPKTVLTDDMVAGNFKQLKYDPSHFVDYLNKVLQIEGVACKDWLTNKVDRSVTGRGAVQQTAGEIQLPLNDLAVVSLDYQGKKGVATSIGHAPVAAMISPEAGSRLAVGEALTNLIWAPLVDQIKSVSLSANWMWPARNPGENARLYKAVKALSDFCIDLGINVPTGKDSMSMTQKYPDGKLVLSPGTVIVSAVAEVTDVRRVIPQVVVNDINTHLIYVDFSDGSFNLGGSSFAQIINHIGQDAPDCAPAAYFESAFNTIQGLIGQGALVSGHDVSAGGLATCLLEMCFGNLSGGLNVSINRFPNLDAVRLLFSEQPALVIQVRDLVAVQKVLDNNKLRYFILGQPQVFRGIRLSGKGFNYDLDIDQLRDSWYRTSYLLDRRQSGPEMAGERFKNYKTQPLKFTFPSDFTGKFADLDIDPKRRTATGIRSAIIREKGVNGDREMAYAMYLAGMDVKDVHMTDLIAGRETLEDVNFIVFVGGFSNSDVLGSAKGWAGAFLYNPKARKAVENFYARKDTLSLGICNGCQVMMELDLVYPDRKNHPKMHLNASGKFESAFLNLNILPNESVMLKSLAGSRLGIWVAHAEGKFILPDPPESYQSPARFSYSGYPGNPNGSPDDIASLCSADGRHLVMMPHLERAFLPWQWPHYPESRSADEAAPWLEAFVNARNWIKNC